ncbi:MAG: metallophosphoesterase [Planctomycetota bacterium]
MRSKVYLGHLSDFHIGQVMYGNRVHSSDRWPFCYLQSDNCHDDVLVLRLADVWSGPDRVHRRLRVPVDTPIPIAVTGDLTRRGADAEFRLAKSYIEGRWTPPDGFVRGPGLRQGSSGSDLSVPGNHDQWAGSAYWNFPAAFNPFLYRKWFGSELGAPVLLQSDDGTLVVEVHSIDSNSGHLGRMFRPMQGGSISEEAIRRLRDRLAHSHSPKDENSAKVAKRVRIILCHHSFSNLFAAPAPLDEPSLGNLLETAAEYGISVVLTGHTHYTDWKEYTSSTGASTWEIRASSALAAPSAPSTNEPNPQGNPPEICAHGFWVHEIERVGHDKAVWRSHMFQWDGETFKNYPPVEIAVF